MQARHAGHVAVQWLQRCNFMLHRNPLFTTHRNIPARAAQH
jgi:hypothetical protein